MFESCAAMLYLAVLMIDYLAVDSGGYLCTSSHCTLIAAECFPDADKSRWCVQGVNTVKCKVL